MISKKMTQTIAFIYNSSLISLFLITGIAHTKPDHKTYTATKDTIYQSCHCNFCDEIRSLGSTKTYKEHQSKGPDQHIKLNRKISKDNKTNKRTVIIYMAADNDLRPFAARNIQQMSQVGSNENVTIVVHLDIRIAGNKKITRRYLIEKDQVFHIDPYNPLTQQMDSGNPATLISCCEWAIKNYPSDVYDLILWNHGTGILEPPHGKIINPMDLFVFNPSTHRLDLDRTIGFMDAINNIKSEQRGVCWDDTTGNYLSNRKLDIALYTIRQNCLNGEKFGIIGFDACLEQMIEVASFIKKHAHVMVGSEEVELGMGWNYEAVLFPFLTTKLDTFTFARHIIDAYDKTYQSITNDYTLSAINLDSIILLEKNIDNVSKLLIEGLKNQKIAFSRVIKESRNRLVCTYFDEPTYIDLHHFYKNLSNNMRKLIIDGSSRDQQLKDALIAMLEEGIQLIEQLVIANTTGRNLKNARGIAIYFPERTIHSSYKEALFLATNSWGSLLTSYIFG
jgi:hypothetical protein